MMTRPVIVIGGGGHARVLIEVLQASNHLIVGVVDPELAPENCGPFGLPALGDDDALDGYQPNEILLVNGVGGVRSTERRHSVYERFSARGFSFATVIHSSAVISPHANLGEGVQVMAGCVIQCGAVIGANTIINTRASVDHDCSIGRSVHLAPGVTLSGCVTVGNGTHIGTGATVIQGISIGRKSLIAAGAVVYRDLPDDAKLIKFK